MADNILQKKFHVGGFLYNPKTQSVLLHLRDNQTPINPDKWGFFGGTPEQNETPEECFIREMKEELGIDIRKGEIQPLCNYLNKELDIWRYIFYIESNLLTSEMKLGEGRDFRWVPLDQVFGYDLTEKTRLDLETFISKVKK